jgi:hypothetical protein
VDHSTIITWRDKFAQEPEPSDSAQALLEYLKNRPIPTGKATRATAKPGTKYAKELIGCDLHVPFHHDAAFEVFLGLCEKIQPNGVTLNGDTLDMPYISRFRQNPLISNDMQADIDEAVSYLARINTAAPNALKRMCVGNHDLERFINYLFEKCPPLAKLRVLQSFDGILGLSDMGWELVKEGYWLNHERGVRVGHGTKVTNTQGGGSGGSAKKEMLSWNCAGVSGHTHKLGSFYRLDPSGYRVWHEGGCLCDQKKMRVARVTVHTDYDACEDWHLGCVLATWNTEGDSYVLDDIPILENHGRTFCIYRDEEIVA